MSDSDSLQEERREKEGERNKRGRQREKKRERVRRGNRCYIIEEDIRSENNMGYIQIFRCVLMRL